jgi:hypothetical protein
MRRRVQQQDRDGPDGGERKNGSCSIIDDRKIVIENKCLCNSLIYF